MAVCQAWQAAEPLMKRFGLSLLLACLVGATVAGTALAAAQRGPIFLPKQKVGVLLSLRHPRGLERFARAVSDPASPRYREYATVEQLVRRYGAKPRTRARAMRWLARHGLHGRMLATGDFVLARLRPGELQRLLPGRATASATATPGAVEDAGPVPARLRGAVTRITLIGPARSAPAVGPGDAAPGAAGSGAGRSRLPYFSGLRHSGTASGCAAGRSAGESFTPNQYVTAYGLAAMHARGLEGQGEVMATVEGGTFKHSDLVAFAHCFGLHVPPIKVVRLPGEPPFAEAEPTLDLSMAIAGAPRLKKIYAYEGGESPLGLAVTAGAALGSPGHRPDVISISYGSCENELSRAYPGLVVREMTDNVFAVAAGAGISVLVAAGDEGSSSCRAHPAEGTTALPILSVWTPASSVYATAVGGTNLLLSRQNRIEREITWNDSLELPNGGGGGGGTSLLYPRRPWWQAGVPGLPAGRSVPDIAALADDYPGYALYCTAPLCAPSDDPVYGWDKVGGTSAATPLMASAVILADQYAARHGQASLGFLNPLLYRLGENPRTRRGAFRDVVIGNNDIGRALPPEAGGGAPLECCHAKPGYDRATGWGSLRMPGFARLAADAASLSN